MQQLIHLLLMLQPMMRLRYPVGSVVPLAKLLPMNDAEFDLPCPWCKSPTGEDDEICPGCGQHFG